MVRKHLVASRFWRCSPRRRCRRSRSRPGSRRGSAPIMRAPSRSGARLPRTATPTPQFNLGQAYRLGRGVADQPGAPRKTWFERAAAQGPCRCPDHARAAAVPERRPGRGPELAAARRPSKASPARCSSTAPPCSTATASPRIRCSAMPLSAAPRRRAWRRPRTTLAATRRAPAARADARKASRSPWPRPRRRRRPESKPARRQKPPQAKPPAKAVAEASPSQARVAQRRPSRDAPPSRDRRMADPARRILASARRPKPFIAKLVGQRRACRAPGLLCPRRARSPGSRSGPSQAGRGQRRLRRGSKARPASRSPAK